MRVVLGLLMLALLISAASPIRLEVAGVLVSPINTTKIVDYVKAAKKAVYMEVYVFTYRPLADALVDIARRGLRFTSSSRRESTEAFLNRLEI